MKTNPHFHLLHHPLADIRVTTLRDKSTPPAAFREALRQLSALVFFEMCRHLKLKSVKVRTPLKTTSGAKAAEHIVLTPILRAGLGMLDGILPIIPEASVGYIGLFRDEKSLLPQSYYAKLPPLRTTSIVFILDPMLATGGSAAAAVQRIKDAGGKKIIYGSLLAAPEGVQLLTKKHPDVPIYTAALDAKLNPHGFIVPGLGDAGDRQFGT
jgi:uracil phosphoribosyltransferase